MKFFSFLFLTTTAFNLLALVVCNSDNDDFDVIVVGAVFAGLAAGKYFHENNVSNFLILEANDYIGGRVKNVEWNNISVPLGAGWFHGVDENPLLVKKAEKYNLTSYKDSYKFDNIVFRNGKDGTLIPQSTVQNANNLIKSAQSTMDDLVDKRATDGKGTPDVKTGLRWAGFSAETALQNALMFWRYNFENGIEPDVIDSVAYGYTDEDAQDRIVNDKRGFAFPVLEESKPFVSKIKLNKVVTSIEYQSDNNITIRCSDGTTYFSKKVLVTVSTGVLQSKLINFVPNLPKWKIEALSMVPMCHYCKIFLQFESVFWDNSKGYMMLTDTERKDYYVHWQNLNKDGLFSGSKVVMVTLTGDMCKESYRYNSTEIMEQAYQVLKKVFPGATRPRDMVRNEFSSSPYFKGSYSYQVSEINENDYRALGHPVRQSIYFAGEAYNRWEFGYIHSAYENGWEAAKNITGCMSDSKKCLTDAPNFIVRDCASSSAAATGMVLVNQLKIVLMMIVVFFLCH